MNTQSMAQLLGYSGLIPFLGFPLAYAFLADWPRAFAQQGFVIYSLAILSFLAGTQWRVGLQHNRQKALTCLIVSNGLVLYGVAAVLTSHIFLAVVLLALGFLLLLWFEQRSADEQGWYATLRTRLTLAVAAAHGLFAVLLIASE